MLPTDSLPGDLWCCDYSLDPGEQGLISRKIESFDALPTDAVVCSHLAINLGDGMVAQAWKTGVGIYPWLIPLSGANRVIVRRLPDQSQIPGVLGVVAGLVAAGIQYDYGSIAADAMVLQMRNNQDQTRWPMYAEEICGAAEIVNLWEIAYPSMVCSSFAAKAFTAYIGGGSWQPLLAVPMFRYGGDQVCPGPFVSPRDILYTGSLDTAGTLDLSLQE